MQASDLILSDSGGMQEEAPALGIPLLILRDRTERPEGIASGNAILVGRDPDRILSTVEMLLESDEALQSMRRPSLPYGDGRVVRSHRRRSSRPGSGGTNLDRHRSRSATQSAEPSTRFASRM